MLLARAFVMLLVCLPLPAGAETGPVVAEIAPDGTLVSAEGEAMRLAHIRLPAALGEARLQRAATALMRGAVGAEAQVLGVDRWLRPLVSVTLEGRTLQDALLRGGLALADVRSNLAEDAAPLYAAEAAARRGERGLWAAGLRVYDAAEAMPEGVFGIVEGRIVDVAKVGGRIYVNFGEDYRTDFTVLLEGDVSRALARWTPPVTEMAGYRVRVRGMLEDWNGPLLRLTGERDMETLSPGTEDHEP